MAAHVCHAEGCIVRVAVCFLMCPTHWNMLSRRLKARVWATHVAGQERRHALVTLDYLRAARAAIDEVATLEGLRREA